jgi:hypothetical protein
VGDCTAASQEPIPHNLDAMSYLFKSRSEQTPLTPASSEEQLAKVKQELCHLATALNVVNNF